MSAEDQTSNLMQNIRIDVRPDPTEDDLVAILQALNLLRVGPEESELAGQFAAESLWEQRARAELLRPRNWPPQVRSWAFKRS